MKKLLQFLWDYLSVIGGVVLLLSAVVLIGVALWGGDEWFETRLTDATIGDLFLLLFWFIAWGSMFNRKGTLS